MAERTLRNCKILVLEDEYMLAEELRSELLDEGAIVIGPVARLEDARKLIEAESELDGAILDVNLGGEMVFPVADMLAEQRVPFVFTTGYDAGVIPPRFSQIARCEKPVDISKVAQAIGKVIHG